MKQLAGSLFFLLIPLFSTVYAAETTASRHRVALNVSCKDDILRSQITSFLTREFRSLGDVDITDENPSFKIALVAISVKLKGGHEAGYAYSVVITSPLGDWSWALSEDLKPDSKRLLSQMLAEQETLEAHKLLVGSFSDLRQSLTEIIAKFDADKLEPRRRMWQQLKDSSP